MNHPKQDILILDGTLIDPGHGLHETGDLFIQSGMISSVPPSISSDTRIIRARGLWVTPGLVDVHVHLREPGFEHKETIQSGLSAAAAGGFTSVVAMPNTKPAIDHADVARWVLSRRPKASPRLYCAASMTLGREGKVLADMPSLLSEGVVAFTDDGQGLVDDLLMIQALFLAASNDALISQHCEDNRLSHGGLFRSNAAQRLGVKAWPAIAEESMLRRDLSLLKDAHARYHAQHLSTSGSVEALDDARSQGLDVSAEVTPHHLFFTEDMVPDLGSSAKVNPPIGTKADRDCLRKALAEGILDMISTDHAPHTIEEKNTGIESSPFGIAGLETAVPVVLSLVHQGLLSPLRMIQSMSTKPAHRFRLPGSSLAVGSQADITLIDPEHDVLIDPGRFHSKARISPFEGLRLKGSVVATIVEGQAIYDTLP